MERPSARALSGSFLAPKSTSITAARINRCQGLSSPSIFVLLRQELVPAHQGRLQPHGTPRGALTHLPRGHGRVRGAIPGQGGGGLPADVGRELSGLHHPSVLAEPEGEPAHPFAIRGTQDHPQPAVTDVRHLLARVVLRHPAPVRRELDHHPQVLGRGLEQATVHVARGPPPPAPRPARPARRSRARGRAGTGAPPPRSGTIPRGTSGPPPPAAAWGPRPARSPRRAWARSRTGGPGAGTRAPRAPGPRRSPRRSCRPARPPGC